MLNFVEIFKTIIVPVITTIGGIIGGLIALLQYIKANKVKRIELINQLIETIRFNNDLQKALLIIDYEYGWYNEHFHNNKNGPEMLIDKLLAYLTYICYLKEMKFLSDKEFEIFQYQLTRVCRSPDIQSYLWNLYHFSKKNNSKCSFFYLINFGLKNNLFHHDFLNSESKIYPKYLNF